MRPEVERLKLSDSFLKETDTHDIEIICTVYNINPGNNGAFMAECRVINDYTAFIEKVRELKQKGVAHPIDEAINYCIEHQILAEFLAAHYEEVLKSMTLNMTFEAREELIKRDAYEDGVEAGREEGRASERITAIRRLLASGLDASFVIEKLGYSTEEYEAALKGE